MTEMNTTTPMANTPTAERPWPVVLLTALGAWLATIPLAGVVGLLLGDLLVSGIGPYFIGPLLLIGAAVVLRSDGVTPFVEQLAVPALLLGGVTLGFGLYRDLPETGASLTLAVVALGVAWVIRGAWLQALLGACACALVLVGLSSGEDRYLRWGLWWGVQGCVLLWTALLAWHPPRSSGATLDALRTGWLLTTLAGLAFGSGSTFLVGAVFDGGGLGSHSMGVWSARSAWSAGLAAVGGLVLGWRWPALRQLWAAGSVVAALGLAWFMPALGAVWLVAALCATTGRPRQAAAAGVAAVWIIGAFYYQLAWSLVTKAEVLIGVGATLGGLAWWGWRAERTATAVATAVATAPAQAPSPNKARLGIALCAAAVLTVINGAIWQKEDLIARGRPVYIELAPVDPRSLMQGDYMALNYRLDDTLREQLASTTRLERPVVQARVDARGVARLERMIDPATDAVLPADALRIEMTPKEGRWVVVSDAWFFREGDGERWAAARYGEFRVLPDGRALLVGLADADLKPISPAATVPPSPGAAPAPVRPASGG